MATPLPAHSIVQVRMVGNVVGQQVMTVLHYRYNSATPADDYRAEMNTFDAAFTAVNKTWDKWRLQISQSVEDIRIYYQPVYPTRLTAVVLTPPLTTGGVVGTDLPTNTSATITKTSDVAARYGRGSVHLPGQVQEHINTETLEWAAGFQASLGEFADTLLLEYEVEDFAKMQPVIWNLKTPDRYNFITGRIVQVEPRVERRRTLRVGK